MGTITNVIKTLFTTSGADAAEGAADRVGRAQTRLGNASAGAGRQFAAQSAGLGGLVGAYAGAAATSFALTAAFTALSDAARSLQTVQGLSTLAASSGQDGATILANLQKITKGQLTLVASAEQASLSLSAGFDTSQISGLATVATKASKALGRDLADSMTRLTRGSAKMEAELLDELGIYTKIEPATRAYAAAIGKTTSSLSEYERRQAFVNAVITEGMRKFGMINTTIPSSADAFQKLSATIQNLTTQLTSFIADVLAPLANFLSNNVAASFGALGIIISLVAGKGLSLFSEGMINLSKRMHQSGLDAENTARKYLGLKKAVETAAKGIETTVISAALPAPQAARLGEIQDISKKRALTRAEFKESSLLLQQNIAARNREVEVVKANLLTKNVAYASEIKSLTQLEDKIKELAAVEAAARKVPAGKFGTPEFTARTVAINAAIRDSKKLAGAKEDFAAIALNTSYIEADTKAIKDNALASQGAKAAISGMVGSLKTGAAKTVESLSRVAGTIASVASSAFFWISTLQLIGSGLAALIGKSDEYNAFFSALGQGIQNFLGLADKKKVGDIAIGVTSSTLKDLEIVQSELRNIDSFTFSESKVLGIDIKVSKTKEELAIEVSNILTDVINDTGSKKVADSLTSGWSIGFGAAGATLGLIFGGPFGAIAGAAAGAAFGTGLDQYFNGDTSEMEALATKYGAVIKNRFATELGGMDTEVQTKAIQALSKLEDIYAARSLTNPSARAAKKLQEELILGSIEATTNVEGISEAMIATGKSADQIVKSFDFTPAKNQISYIDQAITTIAGKTITFKFIDQMDESLKDTLNTFTYDLAKMPSIKPTNWADEQMFNTLDAKEQVSAIADLTSTLLKYRSANVDADTASMALAEHGDITRADYLATKDTTEALYASMITLNSYFKTSAGSINDFQRGVIRGGEVLSTLDKGIAENSISLEQFSQGMNNSKAALIDSGRAYGQAITDLQTFSSKVDSLKTTFGADDPRVKQAQELLIAMTEQLGLAKENLDVERQIYDVVAKREAALKNAITMSDFFKSFKKDPKNKLNLEIEFIQIGNNPLEQFKTSLAYLEQFKQATLEQVATYSAASKALDKVQLKPEEKAGILGASTMAELKEAVSSMKGVKAEAIALPSGISAALITTSEGLSTVIELSVNGSGKIVNMSNDAIESQKEIVRQAIESLPAFIDAATKEYKTLIEGAKKEADSIIRKEMVAKVKFDIDIKGLQADLSQQLLEAGKTAAEINYKAVVATPGVTDKELAVAGNALVESQRLLIEKQQAVTMEDYHNKADLLDKQAMASKIAIADETAMQVRKIRDNSTYVAAISAAATSQGQIIIEAGNSVGESILQGFNQGAAVISTALGKFGGAVVPATFEIPAVPEYEATAITIQKSADSFAMLSEETIKTLYTTELIKFNEVDTNAQREKAIAAQTVLNTLYGNNFKSVSDIKNTLSEIIVKEGQRAKAINDQLALDKMQYAINIANAANDLANTKAQITQAAMSREIELSNILIDNDEKRLDLVKQQVAFISEAAKSSKPGDAQLQDQIANRVTPYIQDLTISIDDYSVTAAAKKLNDAIASAKPKDINKASIELEAAVQQNLMNKRLALFDQETALLSSELIAKAGDLAARQAILALEGDLAAAKAAAEAAAIEARKSIALAEVANTANLAQVVNSFGSSVQAFGAAISQGFTQGANSISSALGMFGGTAIPVTVSVPDFTPITVDTAGATAAITSAFDAESAAFKAATDAAKTVADKQAQGLEAQRKALGQEYLDLVAKRKATREGLSVTDTTRLEDLSNQLYNLDNAAGGGGGGAAEAVERLTGRLAELQSSIKGSLESSFMSINDAIINGAEDGKNGAEVLRDAIRSLFSSIQEEVFKQTIATPIAETVSNWLVGGLSSMVKTDILGSPLAGVAGSAVNAIKPEDLTKNVMGPKAVDAGVAYFKSAGDKLSSALGSVGTGVNAAAGVGATAISGAAQTLATTTATSTGAVASANVAGASTLMSSLGPILAVLAVIAVIAGLFNGKKAKAKAELAATPSTVTSTTYSPALMAAQPEPANLNSIPKMAIGGLRDRVPTMLEPGEFIIRKPMVNKIGIPTLESMNATGTIPEQQTNKVGISTKSSISSLADSSLSDAIKASTATIAASSDIGANTLITAGNTLANANKGSTTSIADSSLAGVASLKETSISLSDAIKASTATIAASSDIGANTLITAGNTLANANKGSTTAIADSSLAGVASLSDAIKASSGIAATTLRNYVTDSKDLTNKALSAVVKTSDNNLTASTKTLATSVDKTLTASADTVDTTNNNLFDMLRKTSKQSSIEMSRNSLMSTSMLGAALKDSIYSVTSKLANTTDTSIKDLANSGNRMASSINATAKLSSDTLVNSNDLLSNTINKVVSSSITNISDSAKAASNTLGNTVMTAVSTIADSISYGVSSLQNPAGLVSVAQPEGYTIEQKPISIVPESINFNKPMAVTPALAQQPTNQVTAPVINIKNEGSPKDASASPPRFDGEKYVIDIVMRDLANNGPIRKSLRGGAL